MKWLVAILMLVGVPVFGHGPTQEGAWLEQFQATTKACARGKQLACVELGEAYELGHGTRANLDRAKELYADACFRHVGPGCSALGELTGSPAQKEQLFERACKLGAQRGCSNLALMLEGRAEADVARARKLLEHACKANDALGCSSLAHHLELEGQPHEAWQLYDRACGLDTGAGCYQAGLHAERVSLPERALFYFRLSCTSWQALGCRELEAHCARGETEACPKQP